jgi:hypothetical protein
MTNRDRAQAELGIAADLIEQQFVDAVASDSGSPSATTG